MLSRVVAGVPQIIDHLFIPGTAPRSEKGTKRRKLGVLRDSPYNEDKMFTHFTPNLSVVSTDVLSNKNLVQDTWNRDLELVTLDNRVVGVVLVSSPQGSRTFFGPRRRLPLVTRLTSTFSLRNTKNW